MNYLLVGDMHVKRDNVEESQKLIDWIHGLSQQYNARVIFLGDQYNDFGLVRVEVLEFWKNVYKKIPNSISLVGNHDLNPAGVTSSMIAHEGDTLVVGNKLTLIDENLKMYAVGFIRDKVLFSDITFAAKSLGAKILLCHAEFNGAQYENGFYAPHGVELDKVPNDIVYISGHIHKKQDIKNKLGQVVVRYVGTPRMLTRSDIGDVKGVTLLKSDGYMEFIPTPENVCEPFKEFVIEEGQPIPKIDSSAKVFVEVRGNQDFIKKVTQILPENIKVRTIIKNDDAKIVIKESEGINVSFHKFFRQYAANNKLDGLESKILEDIYSMCPFLKQ
jgi:DNA repair exonuclease SbcCD nuclease subunit